MTQLIARIRTLIADPSGPNEQFDDQTIQDTLDEHREDVWYEQLKVAEAIVNAVSTNNQPRMIFADYYSNFTWLEGDAAVQGNSNGQAYVVLTPAAFEPIVGHWQFELNVLTQGTFPGQYPPVFFVGKSYDPYGAAANLCDIWSAYLASAYDITVDGQSLKRSQLMQAKQALAKVFRMRAKPKTIKMIRRDVQPEVDSRMVPVLGGDRSFGGIY